MNKLILLFIFILVLFLAPAHSQAAILYFGAPGQEVGVEQQFEVGVFLNTEGENINAVKGEIILAEVLELSEIRDGASIISFYLERPSFTGRDIKFSGIIPGGYVGGQGFLFSFVLRSREIGRIVIDAQRVEVLRHDSQGSAAALKVAPLSLQVVEKAISPEFMNPPDSDPPEPFTPQISREATLFDGQWFLVFATPDKGSGIDRYEVIEGRRSAIVETSPYLLQNQDLDEEIVVRAIDRSGNDRTVRLPPQNPNYKRFLSWGVLLLLMGIGYFIWRKWR